jgi:YVTN family beta-propeller protein
MVSLESRGLGLIARFGDVRDPRFAAATRAGTRLFVPNYADNSVGVFSVTPNLNFFPAQTNRIALNGNPTAAVLNRDESLLFVTLGTDPSIAVINTASLQVVKTIPMPSNLFGGLLSPDGRRLIVASNISDYIYIVDPTTLQLMTSFFVGQGPRGMAISPDSRLAYTANYLDGTISIFNIP